MGPDDRIYVAGEGAIRIFRADGQPDATVTIAGTPRCVAVGGRDHVVPGRIYVGVEGRIHLFSPDGQPAGVWDGLGDRALVTSVAPAGAEVFVADAGHRTVLRLDADGRILNRIGNSTVGRGAPGFIVPSPYFDVVAGPDGLLYAVNPGARQRRDLCHHG